MSIPLVDESTNKAATLSSTLSEVKYKLELPSVKSSVVAAAILASALASV